MYLSVNSLQCVQKRYHWLHGVVKYHWLTVLHELLKVGYLLIQRELHAWHFRISCWATNFQLHVSLGHLWVQVN